MAVTTPWILFHAPWTPRIASGVALLTQIERSLATVAVDPSPDSAKLSVAQSELVEPATAAFGPAGPGGPGWHRERPFDLAPLVAFFEAHEGGRAAARPVELMVSYWFEVKRPGAGAALYPGAPFASSLMVWLGSHRINLSLRYATGEPTQDLLDAHTAIVGAIEPRPKRGVLQRIVPLGPGRERREPIG